VNELVRLFGRHWSDAEVEATIWKLTGDAAAEGRLLVDLTEVMLERETPLSLLDSPSPPILPDPLPCTLEYDDQSIESPMELTSEKPSRVQSEIIPGPTFDASTLESDEERDRFYRNLAAVTAVLAGEPRRQVAKEYQMHPFTLARLEQRVQQFGQLACVPHATYHRDRTLRPEFQELLRKLYALPIRPTMMAVYEDVQLQQLATKLSEQENMLVKTPTYKQVKSFLKGIAQEPSVIEARAGTKHHPPERMSTSSFVLGIPYPAHLCQVDEHTMDLFVTTLDGVVITRRVHAAVLICVKTAAILGAVLALDALCEEDYMRLVKMAIEPKDRITALYECQHPWPCFGKPAVIFHDRGKVFTSERATQVLVDRLGITTEQAPPYAPSANDLIAYYTPSA
jgi:transposase